MSELNNKNSYNSNPFTLSFNAFGRLFKHNTAWAVVLIVFGVIGFLINMVSNLAQLFAENTSSSTTSSYSQSSSPEFAIIIAAIIFIGVILLVFSVAYITVYTYIKGMFAYVALKSEEEKSVDFKEAFDAVSKRFWRLLLSSILAQLKIIGWTLLFIIPGIIASLKYSLLPYLIMSESESEKGIKDSHDKTKAVSKNKLMEVFGVSTVGALIPIIGSVIDLSGKAALFNQLSYYNQNNLEKPKTHWLNYIGLMLIGAFILFLVFILVLVLIIAIAKQ